MKSTNNWLQDGLEIMNPKGHDLSPEIIENMRIFCIKIDAIQHQYGDLLVLNRGYSTPEEQLKINPKAPNSLHCKGLAIDVSDRTGHFWEWLTRKGKFYSSENGRDKKEHPEIESNAQFFDIYLEDRGATPTWVHIQDKAPKSGNRIFKP